jgi:glycosyltransferase involved in cell wall biosynthesis
MVHVVPPGIDPRFTPGGDKSPTPLVVAVGRLVPVKRFDLLVESVVELRRRHPGLECVIVGEGYRREELEAQIHQSGAERYISLPGRIGEDELIELYRMAWVLASASAREGWGMTLTEAAACGTPAVVTRIAGHEDAVAEGVSGLLVDSRDELTAGLERVLVDPALRERLTAGAIRHAEQFTWAATARGTLEVLAAEAIRRRLPH